MSDGLLSPTELVRKAHSVGLRALAITDHDHTGGVAPARAAAEPVGIEIIAGVELSVAAGPVELHMLGLFVEPEHPSLVAHLARERTARIERAERIVAKLSALGAPVELTEIQRRSGGGSVGRPHIAAALIAAGHVGSHDEAFARYLASGAPAYEPVHRLDPTGAIRLVAEAGGLSFLAHPGRSIPEPVLLELIRAGLDGIETVHPSHSPERTRFYRGVVDAYCLLETGGSDFHGSRSRDEDAFGRYGLPVTALAGMRRRLQVG